MPQRATLSLNRDTGERTTKDKRFRVNPAYAPSIFGGSVSRPSYYTVLDTETGKHWTEINLERVREVLNSIYARSN